MRGVYQRVEAAHRSHFHPEGIVPQGEQKANTIFACFGAGCGNLTVPPPDPGQPSLLGIGVKAAAGFSAQPTCRN
jgi:hypothetical protein